MNALVSATTLASVTSVAAPSIAATVDQCSFPELLARLEAVRARWWDRQQRDAKGQAEYDALVAQAVAAGGHPDDVDVPETGEAVDRHGVAVEWNEINDEILAVYREIIARVPQTSVDVGIVAQAFALRSCEYWNGSSTDDGIVAIFNGLAAFAGVECLPGGDLSIFDVYNTRQKEDHPQGEPEKASDPVYALIARHRTELEAFKVADEEHTMHDRLSVTPKGRTKAGCAANRRAEKKMHKAWEKSVATVHEIIECAPRTRFGTRYKAEYLQSISELEGLQGDPDFWRRAFHGLVAATAHSA